MAGAFYPNYFKLSDVDEQDAERIMTGHDPHTTVMVSGLPHSRHNETNFTPHIIRFFEGCGRISQIHYDSGRAYIEFQRLRVYSSEWDSALSVPGSSLIVPSVYTALKLRQIRNGSLVIPIDREENPEENGEFRSRARSSQVGQRFFMCWNLLLSYLLIMNRALSPRLHGCSRSPAR